MSNEFYEASGTPATRAPGASSPVRAEFEDIEAGFDKMPVLTGASNHIVVVNSGGSAMTTTPSLTAAQGGTGFTSYAIGDLLYASTTTELARLADVVAGNALISGGVGTAPVWGKIGMTTHVTGILPPANGGTGALTPLTQGSVVFAGGSGILSQDNANLFWDDANNRLGVGTATPTTTLDVRDNVNGPVTVASFTNSSAGASSRVTVVQSAGSASVSRLIDLTGQYLQEGGTNAPTRYSDFNSHVFRNTAGVAQASVENNAITVYGSTPANTVILTHDNTNASLRPTNTGSRLLLGGNNVTSVIVSDAGALPSTTKVHQLGAAASVWNAVHVVSDIYYGSTSGTVTVTAPATAGTRTIAWPAASGTVALTTDITAAAFLPTTGGALSGPGNLTVGGTLGVTGAMTGTSAAFTGTVSGKPTVTALDAGGSTGAILAYDVGTGPRVTTTGSSTLHLGVLGTNYATVNTTGLHPYTTRVQQLGALSSVWNGLHTVSTVLYGSTSGTVTLAAPSIAGTVALTMPATSGTLALYGELGFRFIQRIPVGAATASVYLGIPADVVDIMFTFDLVPTTSTANNMHIQVYHDGSLDLSGNHYAHSIMMANNLQTIGTNVVASSSTAASALNSWVLNYFAANNQVSGTSGIRGRVLMPYVVAARRHAIFFETVYISDDTNRYVSCVGSGMNIVQTGINGVILYFNTGTINSGYVTLWGAA